MKPILTLTFGAVILAASAFANATVITNGSFETNNVDVGSSSLSAATTVADGWTFTGNAGVTSTGYAAWYASTDAGDYVGYLQGTSSISQTFTVDAVANYVVSLELELREAGYTTAQVVTVSLDDIVLGTYSLASGLSATMSDLITSSEALSIGTHTLTISGITANTSTTDSSAFVDNVAVYAVPEPGSIALLLPGGLGIMGAVARRRQGPVT